MAVDGWNYEQLSQIKRPRLQALCKKHGIKANQKNKDLIEALLRVPHAAHVSSGVDDDDSVYTECDSEMQELASMADQEGEYELRHANLHEIDVTTSNSTRKHSVEQQSQRRLSEAMAIEEANDIIIIIIAESKEQNQQCDVALLPHDEDLSNLEPLEDEDEDEDAHVSDVVDQQTNEFDIVDDSFDQQPQELIDESDDHHDHHHDADHDLVATLSSPLPAAATSSNPLALIPIVEDDEGEDDDPLAEYATDLATNRTSSCDMLDLSVASPLTPTRTLVLQPSDDETVVRASSQGSASTLSVDNLLSHDAQLQQQQQQQQQLLQQPDLPHINQLQPNHQQQQKQPQHRLMRVSEWLIRHRKQHVAQTRKHPHAVSQIRNSPKLSQSHPPPVRTTIPLSQAMMNLRKEDQRRNNALLRASASSAPTATTPRTISACPTTINSSSTATPSTPSTSIKQPTAATPTTTTPLSTKPVGQLSTTRSRQPSISRATLAAIARREAKDSTTSSSTITRPAPIGTISALPTGEATTPAKSKTAPDLSRATTTASIISAGSLHTTRSTAAKATGFDSSADGARPGHVTGTKRKRPNFDGAHEKLFEQMAPITDSNRAKRAKVSEQAQPSLPPNLFRPNNSNEVSSPAKRSNALSSVAVEAETAARLASPSTPTSAGATRRGTRALKHQATTAVASSPLRRPTASLR